MCTTCNQNNCNGCSQELQICNQCPQQECDCPILDLSTDCVLYTGDDIVCNATTVVTKNTILSNALQNIVSWACNRFSEIQNYFRISNVGTGIGVYAGENLLGEKKLRSIKSAGGTVTVTTSVDGNEINLEVGEQQAPCITSDDSSVTIIEADGCTDLSVDLDKSFLDLTDVIPSDYTGDSLKLVRVNSAETGLEFIIDDSIKQIIAFDPTTGSGSNSTYASGVATLPNVSESSNGVMTNGVQQIGGNKTWTMQGNSSNTTYGFVVRNSSYQDALQIAEDTTINIVGLLRILNNVNVIGNKIFLFYPTGYTSDTVGVLKETVATISPGVFAYQMSIGSNQQQDRRIRIDTNTGNTTIGAATDSIVTTQKFEVYSIANGSIPYPIMTNTQRTDPSFVPKVGCGVYVSDVGANEGIWIYKSTGWVHLI